MALPDIIGLRERFEIHSQIRTNRLQMCLDDALDLLRQQLGIEAFNEIFTGVTATIEDSVYLDENITTTDEVALRLSRCTRAAYYYAIADVVMNTNLRIRPSGIVKKEQDAASPAVGAGSQVINEYISVADAQEYAGWLRGKADTMIGVYVIAQDPIWVGQVELIRG